MKKNTDIVIIGAGIVGLTIADTFLKRDRSLKILILEKEKDVAFHGSGRNSGVLHAGFYYSANSLKAKFCKEGNQRMKEFCQEHNLSLNENGKLVVTKDGAELEGLYELEKRGKLNGVDVSLVDEKQTKEIEPYARTISEALYSPSTATVDPVEVSGFLKKRLVSKGVVFLFDEGFKEYIGKNQIRSEKGTQISYKILINSAGLYADKIAKSFGFSSKYTILPFKGIYLKYNLKENPIKTNLYPVPNLDFPFLGVHFTVTVANELKIGPTAMPCFWRENYDIKGFNANEMLEISKEMSSLLIKNSFNFRNFALEEMKKYRRDYFLGLGKYMLDDRIDLKKFDKKIRPGIRSQLLNTETRELVQDFVVEGDESSVHILNAVSPAFTCSFPFSDWVIDNYVRM